MIAAGKSLSLGRTKIDSVIFILNWGLYAIVVLDHDIYFRIGVRKKSGSVFFSEELFYNVR